MTWPQTEAEQLCVGLEIGLLAVQASFLNGQEAVNLGNECHQFLGVLFVGSLFAEFQPLFFLFANQVVFSRRRTVSQPLEHVGYVSYVQHSESVWRAGSASRRAGVRSRPAMQGLRYTIQCMDEPVRLWLQVYRENSWSFAIERHKVPMCILIVDDSALIRRMIRETLEQHGGWEVSGEAADGREAIEKAQRLKPDLGSGLLSYFAYNFIKIHRTLRISPAMAAGVTDRLWSVEDLVALWEAYEQRRAERAA
jgi:hypothetical protein